MYTDVSYTENNLKSRNMQITYWNSVILYKFIRALLNLNHFSTVNILDYINPICNLIFSIAQ